MRLKAKMTIGAGSETTPVRFTALQRAAFWLTRLDPTGAEMVLAGSALMFGVALLVPADLSLRSPAFHQLIELFPQQVWALIWIALGVAQGAGACSGYGRRQADVAAACLWVFWVVLQVVTLGATIGPFSYGWLAVSSITASHLQRRHGSD
jgi:hypothetical protein